MEKHVYSEGENEKDNQFKRISYSILLLLTPVFFITLLPLFIENILGDPFGFMPFNFVFVFFIGGSVYLLLGIMIYALLFYFPRKVKTPNLVILCLGVLYGILINILYFMVLKFSFPGLVFELAMKSSLNVAFIIIGVYLFLLYQWFRFKNKEND